MHDSVLIKKCQNNEPSAQRQLFDGYYKYVYTIAFRYLNNHHDCEDVVLIVFNKVFKNIHRVVSAENDGLKRWIQTIAINEAIRFLNKKHPFSYTDDDSFLDQMEPEAIIEDSVNIHQIKRLIQEMPEGYRRIFLLHSVEGLTHAEIAQHLNISRNTSKSQMIKARKYLQAQIKNYESQQIR